MTRIDSNWIQDKKKYYVTVFSIDNTWHCVRRELYKSHRMDFASDTAVYRMLENNGYKMYQSFYRETK